MTKKYVYRYKTDKIVSSKRPSQNTFSTETVI